MSVIGLDISASSTGISLSRWHNYGIMPEIFHYKVIPSKESIAGFSIYNRVLYVSEEICKGVIALKERAVDPIQLIVVEHPINVFGSMSGSSVGLLHMLFGLTMYKLQSLYPGVPIISLHPNIMRSLFTTLQKELFPYLKRSQSNKKVSMAWAESYLERVKRSVNIINSKLQKGNDDTSESQWYAVLGHLLLLSITDLVEARRALYEYILPTLHISADVFMSHMRSAIKTQSQTFVSSSIPTEILQLGVL